ncbi:MULTISPECIES: helix-turn-helix domain-containing protein [unclassified Acidovorax]|uniref:transcriptional regulator n=1 Tax=unclassified Acidovorax TaxID=2684926 RepID=UPI002883097F|nr:MULTISPECIES: helix-turn-helix domain-containing protein [unclassified Acidovorax]
MEHPIERAAKLLGNQTHLAAALKVSKGAVSQWKEPSGRVPAEHCPAIERLTGGAVRCEQLRPDIEWSVLRREMAPTAEVIHG